MDRLCLKKVKRNAKKCHHLIHNDSKTIKKQLVAIMYMQINDVIKAADVLKVDKNGCPDNEIIVFRILLLSNAIKSSLK